MTTFNYEDAFNRNIGWVTRAEQQKLRSARIAIAGMGGVGGSHLLTLTRLGIGKFTISDCDGFDIPNFNRQAGAFMSTLGKPKLETLANMALDINPELELRQFPDGVHPDTVDDFLDGADVYVDSIDIFAMDVRRALFAACARRGIPAITCAPMAMGSAMLYFRPGGMTFEEYFQLEGQPLSEQLIRLIAGLSPSMMQRHYLQVLEGVNFSKRKAPSTCMGIELCAGVMGTEVLKVLLGRGEMRAVPWGLHFDAYLQKYRKTWRPGGNSHPLQRYLMRLIRAKLNA